MNDAQNAQIDLSKFNLENIQQITLYIGQPPLLCQPARAYASASVLSIVPVHPRLTSAEPYHLTAGIKGGSFGLVNPYAQWQQRLSDHWSFTLNTNAQNANGRYKYRTAGTGSDTLATRQNAGIKSLQTDAAFYWKKNDSSKFILRVNEYAANQGLPDAVITYDNTIGGQHLWSNDMFIQASYEHIWKSSLHLLLNAKLSNDDQHYLDAPFLNQLGKLEQFYRQQEAYQSAALSYHIIPNWEVGYASDLAYTALDMSSVTINGIRHNASYPKRLTLLTVFSTKFALSQWLFQGSVLNTYVNDQVSSGIASSSRDIYSPAVEASWHPFAKKDFQFKAFYKDIFRYPTFNDLYYSEIGQRNLKPEFVKQYNLSADYTKALNGFINDVSAFADIFYNSVKDKIVAIPSQNAFIWSIVNFGKVDIRGFDFSLKAQTTAIAGWRFKLSANYTYQNALNITDPNNIGEYNAQLPYTPKQVVAVNAGVIYHRLSFYYNQISSSRRYTNNDESAELPAYSVSDASLSYTTHIKQNPLNLSLEINNLFNKSYQVISSFPMPGTSIRFTVQVTI